MATQLRLRYVNEAAGALVLGTLALLIFAVVMTGHAQRWFQPVRRLMIALPQEGSMGLGPGSEVFILGVSVGTVDDIAPDAEGRMRAEVRIRSDYGQFLHADSIATIRKTFGVAGDAYLDISRGSGAPLPATGAVIQGYADRAPTELLGDALVRIRDEAVPTLKQVQATLEQYRQVAADLRDPDGHLQQVLSRADRLTAGLENGHGLATRVLADPALAREFEATVAKTNESLDQAQDLLKDARRTTSKLPESVAELDRTLQALPGMVEQMQETMRQTQRLVEGAQKSWLVRSYVEPEQRATRRIDPADVGAAR